MAKKKKSQKNTKDKIREKQAREKARRMKSLTVTTLVVLLLAAGVFYLVQSASDGGSDNRVEASVFQYDKQPVIGNDKAKVKIVEFGDYKCPVCKRFKDEIFPQLKKDFLDNDKAGFYFINNQFIGEDSITAGIAGEAVYRQNKEAFWKYYQAVYDHQGSEQQTWATPEFLVGLAKKEVPGIDHGKLAKDIQHKTYEENVKADKKIGEEAGVSAVPALFINGKPVELEVIFDYPRLKQMIEDELEKAR
ncbi:DsbA family protein [Salinithrix halophila]|uniref:DsbA family protein n=1 Tax=Salinithrix halophila TaxID=1485204 RepID=A0ABV8JFX9_9BACL